jgi:hypothetical protein
MNSEKCVKSVAFLMTSDAEKAPLLYAVEEGKTRLSVTKMVMSNVEKNLKGESYFDVRVALDGELCLKEEEQPRNTPKSLAVRYQDELRQKVLNYCKTKLASRDAVIDNEWYLKARLKKPLAPGLTERPEDLGKLPEKYYAMIPASDMMLEDGLKQMSVSENGGDGNVDSRLNNSMGYELVKSKRLLDHVVSVVTEQSVKDRMLKMYDSAVEAYLQVAPKNKLLLWYRDEKHDGKMSTEEYKKLQEDQVSVIELIQKGDGFLNDLNKYSKELHEQFYVMVSRTSSSPTTFSHSELAYDFFNDDWYIKHYSTSGFKFYYTLTMVTPGGSKDEEVYVGEKDESDTTNYRSWDYRTEEQVGWVRKWKKLHEDGTMIKKGWKKDLSPCVEPSCEQLKK